MRQKWQEVLQSNPEDDRMTVEAERNYHPWALEAKTAYAAEKMALCDCKVWETVLWGKDHGKESCQCDNVLPTRDL